MDLEPQRDKKQPPRESSEEEPLEAIEGMTERDLKTDDLRDSPLKIFMKTEFFLLMAGLIIGAIYFFFFRDL